MSNYNDVNFIQDYETDGNYTKGSETIVTQSFAQISSSISESITPGATDYAINCIKANLPPTQSDAGLPVFDYGTYVTIEAKINFPADDAQYDAFGALLGKSNTSNKGWKFDFNTDTPRRLGCTLNLRDGSTDHYVFDAPDASHLDTSDGGTWHDVCITFTNGSQRMFHDGVIVQEKTVAYDSTLAAVPEDLIFGKSAGAARASGSIAQFRISNKILYSANYTPSESYTVLPSTTLLYNFDEGTGNYFYDEVGGITGSINGGSWVEGPNGTGAGTTSSAIIYSNQLDVYQASDETLSGSAVLYSLSASMGATGSDSDLTFQIKSKNNYWEVWDTGSSEFVSASYNQRNSLTTLNNNLLKFPASGSVNVRVFAYGDGTENIQVDNLTLLYYTGSCNATGGGTTVVSDDFIKFFTLAHLQGSPTVLKT